MLHPGNGLYLVDYFVGVLGCVQLYVKSGRFSFGADEILKVAIAKNLRAPFPWATIPRHAKTVIQYLDRIPDFDVFGLRENVVHQHIVGALVRAAMQITER